MSEHRDNPALAPNSPVAELLSVALPAVITMTSYTVMQFADNLMVKDLGEGAISAVGNGGIAAFIPGAALMGLLSVVNTFVAQHLGAGTPRKGPAYAWNALWLSFAIWVCVLMPVALLLPEVFRSSYALFGIEQPDELAMKSQVLYGRICLFGMLFTLSARGLGHFFYGVHRPAVVMVSAIAGNLVNLLLCSLWVLGGVGVPYTEGTFIQVYDAPGMLDGIAGAGWSTAIGGLVELLIPLALFVSPRIDRVFATRAAWRPSRRHMKDLLRLGWPAGLMSGNELLCWYIFMVIFVGKFNPPGLETHTDAGWIVLRYMHVSFMPAVGLSIALTAIVGKYIGARDEATAVRRTWLGLALTVVYMSVCAGVMVLFREQLVGVFTSPEWSPEVRERVLEIGTGLLVIAAAFQFFDAVAISLSGALRGAGDTVWPGVVTIVLSWVVLVGGGYAVTEFAPQLEATGPWLGAAAYIIFLAIAFFWRFLSGGWKGKAVAGPSEEPPMDIELGAVPVTGDLGLPAPPSDDTPDRA